MRPLSGKITGETFLTVGKSRMLRFEPFKDGPVGLARHIDQPGDDPDGVLDTLGTDGLHGRQDRANGCPLTIGAPAICDTHLQHRAKPAAG